MSPTAAQKWRALLSQRCPRCCDGKIYSSGKMNQRCAVCDLLFEREPGYFLGAMYVSYGMAVLFLLIGLLIAHWLLPDVDLGWLVLLCAGLFVPFVPMVTRYARVIWIFWDRWAWPSPPGESD
jgi:uncharacterized protein (DUF983 family)